MNSRLICSICVESKHIQANYCKRCNRIINRIDTRGRKIDRTAREKALKEAWDGQGFKCYYSGILLDEHDFKSPRYITFDHRIPRVESEIVIVAAAVNDMKSDLSENEFRNMVICLSNHFKGEPFDERAFDLEHWKRG